MFCRELETRVETGFWVGPTSPPIGECGWDESGTHVGGLRRYISLGPPLPSTLRRQLAF